MTISFTYISDSYFFNKRTYIYPGLMEDTAQADNLAPVWTIQVGKGHTTTLVRGRDNCDEVLMTAIATGPRLRQALFTSEHLATGGGFDESRATWAFSDFDGTRYDWVAGMMQNCWRLEDAHGKTIANFVGLGPELKIKGILTFHEKARVALVSLTLLSALMLRTAKLPKQPSV